MNCWNLSADIAPWQFGEKVAVSQELCRDKHAVFSSWVRLRGKEQCLWTYHSNFKKNCHHLSVFISINIPMHIHIIWLQVSDEASWKQIKSFGDALLSCCGWGSECRSGSSWDLPPKWVASRLLHVGMTFLSILQLDAESSVEADHQGKWSSWRIRSRKHHWGNGWSCRAHGVVFTSHLDWRFRNQKLQDMHCCYLGENTRELTQ